MKPIPNCHMTFSSKDDVISKLSDSIVYNVNTLNNDIEVEIWHILNVSITEDRYVKIKYISNHIIDEHDSILQDGKLSYLELFNNKYLAYEYARNLSKYLSEHYDKLNHEFDKVCKDIYNAKRKTFAEVKVGDDILVVYPNGNTERATIQSIHDGLFDDKIFDFGEEESLSIKTQYLNNSDYTINNVLYTPVNE